MTKRGWIYLVAGLAVTLSGGAIYPVIVNRAVQAHLDKLIDEYEAVIEERDTADDRIAFLGAQIAAISEGYMMPYDLHGKGNRAHKAKAQLDKLRTYTFGYFRAPALYAVEMGAGTPCRWDWSTNAWYTDTECSKKSVHSVADAYVEEHKQVIRLDILAMAFDLNSAGNLVQSDQKRIVDILETEAKIRALPAVYVLDSTGRTIASAKQRTMPDHGTFTPAQIKEAKAGNVVVFTEPNENAVSALIKLDAFADDYLLVTRLVAFRRP